MKIGIFGMPRNNKVVTKKKNQTETKREGNKAKFLGSQIA